MKELLLLPLNEIDIEPDNGLPPEVEDGNRSLPALIRHCGALLVNFPNLHAVLGIKGEKTDTLEPLKVSALF